MNYYPNNFYGNYPYNNNNNHSQYIQPQISQQQYGQIQQTPQPQQQILQGKIVDGEEMVKVTDVPFGGYGIFPRADLNEIYVKTWNSNGTTKITVYKPIVVETDDKNSIEDNNTILLNKMKDIEEKIDSIVNNQQQKPQKKIINSEKGKEIDASAY